MPTQTTDISQTVIAGRKLADYRTLDQDCESYVRCRHRFPDCLVGYVVRETIRDGEVLWHGPVGARGHRECGYDVFVVEGGCRYGDTFEVRDAHRAKPGGHAVVDHLYACGHRSS